MLGTSDKREDCDLMYKVIVVEDEIRVCNLILKLINWEGLGLSLAGTAYDGVSAYELINREKPDIVVTDVRLPGMTGIDLIKKTMKPNLRLSRNL